MGAQYAFRTIALHRFSDLFTCYESDLTMSLIFFIKYNEIRCVPYPIGCPVDILERFAASNTFETLDLCDRYTAKRFLPFALRALITLRPFFVFIRVRKPCVRFLGVL
jgi:hypothetical protein